MSDKHLPDAQRMSASGRGMPAETQSHAVDWHVETPAKGSQCKLTAGTGCGQETKMRVLVPTDKMALGELQSFGLTEGLGKLFEKSTTERPYAGIQYVRELKHCKAHLYQETESYERNPLSPGEYTQSLMAQCSRTYAACMTCKHGTGNRLIASNTLQMNNITSHENQPHHKFWFLHTELSTQRTPCRLWEFYTLLNACIGKAENKYGRDLLLKSYGEVCRHYSVEDLCAGLAQDVLDQDRIDHWKQYLRECYDQNTLWYFNPDVKKSVTEIEKWKKSLRNPLTRLGGAAYLPAAEPDSFLNLSDGGLFEAGSEGSGSLLDGGGDTSAAAGGDGNFGSHHTTPSVAEQGASSSVGARGGNSDVGVGELIHDSCLLFCGSSLIQTMMMGFGWQMSSALLLQKNPSHKRGVVLAC